MHTADDSVISQLPLVLLLLLFTIRNDGPYIILYILPPLLMKPKPSPFHSSRPIPPFLYLYLFIHLQMLIIQSKCDILFLPYLAVFQRVLPDFWEEVLKLYNII